MNKSELDSFSQEELQEIVQQLKNELQYEKKNVKLFFEENLLLKKEIYKLAIKIENLKEILSTNDLKALQESLGVGSSE